MLHVLQVLVTGSVDFNVLLLVIFSLHFIDVPLGHGYPRGCFETYAGNTAAGLSEGDLEGSSSRVIHINLPLPHRVV